MNKSELRKRFLEMRGKLGREEISTRSRQVSSRFFSTFDLKGVRCVHIFLTIKDRGEVETSLIIERIWRAFPAITLVVPRVNRKEKKMECAVYDPMSRLVPNFWGIFEPLNTRTVPENMVDVVLVPLLCFDEAGNRVGYGGGYYDKFLGICRPGCRKIGLSMFEPVDRIDGISEHDIRLDHCVTPEKVWTFGSD